MKKSIFLLLVTVMFTVLFVQSGRAQTASNYSFSTVTNGSLTDMSSGTANLLTVAYHDDDASVVTNIGFTFPFMGTDYTQFSINSNGQMRLGSTAISGGNVTPAAGMPYLIPISGDNSIQSTGKVHYKVNGSAPSRILIVEWNTFRIPYASSTSDTYCTFQVVIYESIGKIEYKYGRMYASGDSNLGICFSSGTSAGQTGQITTITGTPTYNSSSTSLSTTSFTGTADMINLNSISDGNRRVFTFTPPTSAAPTTQAYNLVFSSVTASGLTLGWTNGNGSGRVVFAKQSNTGTTSPADNTSYTANATFGSGSQIGSTGWYCVYNGTGSSVPVTGLSATTDYIFQVFDYNGSNSLEKYITSVSTDNPKYSTTIALVSPTVQAYNITFSSVQAAAMTAGWTNGNGSTRAVFIKQANTGTTSPSDNTTYTANTTFGSGTQIGSSGWYCVYNGSGTSVTITGLARSTDYIVQAFEYNGASGVEKYITTSSTDNPKSQTTTPGLMVGTGQTYTTLGAAFTAINSGTLTGAVYLCISSNLSESTTATLNYSGSGSANYSSVSISPYGGARTISGSVNGALIGLNGADNVTFNGLNSGGNSLIIENTNTGTSASTVAFSNGATGNMITNCTIKGSNTYGTDAANHQSSPTGGVIYFSTGANTSNSVTYCNVGPSGSNKPTHCIVSAGSSYSNSSNTVDHCNIFDYSGGAGTSTVQRDAGIYLFFQSATAWTISNNSFYQTATRNYSSEANVTAIHIRSGHGYTITGNYIGGSSANCTGTMTYTGTINQFLPIDLVDVQVTTMTTISGNYIQGISYTSSSATSQSSTASSRFAAISIQGGGIYADIYNNTIGKTTETGNISISLTSNPSGNVHQLYGIHGGYYSNQNTYKRVSSNTVSGITVTATNGAFYDFTGIYLAGAVAFEGLDNNLIGSTTTANSINLSATGQGTNSRSFMGIYFYSSSISPTLSNNTVQNITRTGSYFYVTGININLANSTISGSTVKNLTSNAAEDLKGINLGAASQTVSGCTIDNLSGAGIVYGIYNYSATPVYKNNFIKALKTTSASSDLYGIYTYYGTIYNNIIVLGYDNAGSSLTNLRFYGIYMYYGASVYFNTVYIGGTGTSGTNSSYALNQSSAGTTDIRNNIFVNARTNSGSGSGSHYAISLPGTSGLTINYNDYYAPGSGGVLGYLSGNKTTLANWRTATGNQDANSLNNDPQFVSPGSNNANDYAPKTNLPGVSGTGITTDYFGRTRGTTPRMGALEAFIWKGTVNTSYNEAGNWLNSQIPPDGASIIFDAAPSNSLILEADKTVGGIVNSQSTYRLNLGGYKLTVQGNIDLTNGATIDAKTGNPTIEFTGSSAQTISLGAFLDNEVYNMTINNSSGVTTNSNVTVTNTLTLTSGILTLGSSSLTLGSSATISGTPSATNMIVATGTGQLIKTFPGTGSFVYPVGDNTGTAEYSPITLNFTSGSFSSATAGVLLSNTKFSSNTSPSHYLNRYWTVTQSGISSFSCDVTAQYLPADVVGTESSIYAGKYSSGVWIGLGQADAVNHRITGTVNGFSTFTGAENGVLPVSLSSFTSSVNVRDVKLNWVTSSEMNNSGFEIERAGIRQEATRNWEKMGFVTGKGTTNTPTNYSFTDSKLATGKYKYRLKQIDNNGNFEYHNLSGEVEVGVPTKYEMSQNYPNPFNPMTKIDFQLPMDGKVSLKIFDITGREMATLMNNEFKKADYYTVMFNGSSLSSGVYFYRITADKYVMTKKMVLVK